MLKEEISLDQSDPSVYRIGGIEFPREVFFVRVEGGRLEVRIKDPWRAETGMRTVSDRSGMQYCISSTDPKRTERYFIPVSFFFAPRLA